MTRIAILQVDSVLPDYQETFGNYPGMFERLLRCAATERQTLQIDTFDVRLGELPAHPLDYHGYIITGGRHSVYDDLPWIRQLVEFVGRVIQPDAEQQDSKIVGICFGHQLIAHYFGGHTGPSEKGWGVGVHSSRVIARPAWMTPELDSFSMCSSHKDQVIRLPTNAARIATSEFCENAGYVIGDRVLAVQGHPEFSKAYAKTLMMSRADTIGQPTIDAALDSFANDTDERIIATWILNFVQPS